MIDSTLTPVKQLKDRLAEGKITQKDFEDGLELLNQSNTRVDSTDCRAISHQIRVTEHPVFKTALLYCETCHKALNQPASFDLF